MPSVKLARMSSVNVLPLGDYPSGQWTSPEVDIADDVTSVDFSIQSCTTATPTIWPNAATVLDVVPECSVDGGVTWGEAGASHGTPGGIKMFKGHELDFVRCGGSLPTAPGRKFRVTTTITNGPLRSLVNLEVN